MCLHRETTGLLTLVTVALATMVVKVLVLPSGRGRDVVLCLLSQVRNLGPVMEARDQLPKAWESAVNRTEEASARRPPAGARDDRRDPAPLDGTSRSALTAQSALPPLLRWTRSGERRCALMLPRLRPAQLRRAAPLHPLPLPLLCRPRLLLLPDVPS